MLVERAELLIKEGSEEEFAKRMDDTGLDLLSGLDGVKAVSFGRGVENPGKFLLLIEWQSMDAHIAFKKDPRYAQFRALLAPFAVGGSMEHFDMSR
jgi:heme-degrading monooxygenase HmoA